MDAIEQDPKRSVVTHRVTTKWNGDVQCTTKIPGIAEFYFDEPAAVGGNNSSPSPSNYVLASLGACQEIVYAVTASIMNIKIENITTVVEGKVDMRGILGLSNEISSGFQEVLFHTKISSPENTETLKRLIDAVERQCPVLDSLRRPIDVKGKVTINDNEEYIPK